jgi:transposase
MFEPLTDQQWALLEPLFPKPSRRGRGKPHSPWRSVVNSILYVLDTGSKWHLLPKKGENPHFVAKSIAHRWFLFWESGGLLSQILTSLGMPTAVAKLPRRKRTPKQRPLELSQIA